jgi:hypothetical protein
MMRFCTSSLVFWSPVTATDTGAFSSSAAAQSEIHFLKVLCVYNVTYQTFFNAIVHSQSECVPLVPPHSMMQTAP